MSPPRKLVAAAELLVDTLRQGPAPLKSILEASRAAGLSDRTLFEARARLPVVCIRAFFGRGESLWSLNGGKVRLPMSWRERKARHCVECGKPLVGHWLRRRCPGCKRAFQSRNARAKYRKEKLS